MKNDLFYGNPLWRFKNRGRNLFCYDNQAIWAQWLASWFVFCVSMRNASFPPVKINKHGTCRNGRRNFSSFDEQKRFSDWKILTRIIFLKVMLTRSPLGTVKQTQSPTLTLRVRRSWTWQKREFLLHCQEIGLIN